MTDPARLQEIGRKLCDSKTGQFHISTSNLAGGRANRGIFLHNLTGPCETSIVEKLSLSTGEKLFYKKYYRELVSKAPGLAPTLFFCRRVDKECVQIFMEHLPTDRGVRPTVRNLRSLARGIAAISSLHLRRWFFNRNSIRINDNAVAKYTERCRRSNALQASWELETLDFLNAEICRLNDITRHFRVVWCHNDLKPEHILPRSANLSSRVCFLDWGLFSPNFAGADFHFLVSAALKKGRYEQSIRALIREYCDAMSRDNIHIKSKDAYFAACYYSLRQNIEWFNHFGKPVFMRNGLRAARSLREQVLCMERL